MEILKEADFIKYGTKIKNCFFIEIGTHNGIQYDPFHNLIIKNKWKKLLIEPNKNDFEKLIEKYNITKIDIISINTESHNYTILNDFPFSKYKPKIIRYKNRHLSKDKQDKLLNKLKENKYNIFLSEDKSDNIAILESFINRIQFLEDCKKIKKIKYKGIKLQQNEYFFYNIKKILNKIKPDRIIEIGTSFGGTTLLISNTLKELGLNNTKIKSFDIRKSPSFNKIQNDNIEYHIENIFDFKNKKLRKSELINNFLSKNGVNLILCDGGKKIEEFKILSSYLKKNDIIMAHDYAPNKEIFKKDYYIKIWNHMEITDADIEDSVNKYNLKPYEMELIKPTAWVCKIKKKYEK